MRPRLLALWVLIVLIPLALVLYAVSRPERPDSGTCEFAIQSPRLSVERVRLSAWSEHAPAQSPQFAKVGSHNRDLPAARLYARGGTTMLAPLAARQDLTYTVCSDDPAQQVAAIWFSLFDRAPLEQWLLDSQAADWSESERYRPATNEGDSDRDHQIALSRAWLRWLNLANPDLRPGWITPAQLEAPTIIGWLQGGVLITAGAPDHVLWIGAQPGLGLGPLLTCATTGGDASSCRLDRARMLALPTEALLARHDADLARLEAKTVLAAIPAEDLQDAVAIELLRSFWQAPALAADCALLSQALPKLSNEPNPAQTKLLRKALDAVVCSPDRAERTADEQPG